MHDKAHPMAGQAVRIKAGLTHPEVPDYGGAEFRLEDWNDRVFGKSWMDMSGHPASLNYAMRAGLQRLPEDNEVVYGKIGPFGHLVHVSELELS